ncbi:glycoside hydrolase family 65 protein [Calycina marina]|uniref:alpha,alpha-trehalase n=1 Tax=Calycina marina TaxID=1763456 RepID=A0A9P7Z0H9_9HELO|nr:glycoside hydrolase family 65 protein [Calycina marina]
MLFLYRCALAVLVTVSSARADTDFSTTSGLVSWNQKNWSLTTNTYIPGQYQARVSLANGYVGASLASSGPFFEKDVNQTDANGVSPSNGWPLFDDRISFTTIAGFFNIQQNASGSNYPWLNQYGWESFIAGIPHSTAIIFAFGDDYLDATASNTTISNFEQSLSFKTGVSTWSYTWSPAGCAESFNVTYSTFFSRARPNVIAVSASITPSVDIDGTVTDLLDGRSALRTYLDKKGMADDSIIYSSVHPTGRAYVTAHVISCANFSNKFTDTTSRAQAAGAYVSQDESTIGQTWAISLKKGETATFYKYVGVASTDKNPLAEAVAYGAQASASAVGWDALLAEHIAAWGEILTESSVDNFTDPATGDLPDDQTIESLQIASVANTFYLLQNLQPEGSGLNDWSVSVGGLYSDSYAGMVFWDADIWMAPGVNLAFPDYAKQISNFRQKQYPQALKNAAFNDYPNGSALYSWTSAAFGNCTGTGPCVDYQYHLNHDIALNMLQQFNITNNATWFNGGPAQVIDSVAISTSHLLELNTTDNSYWIYNATDPDEYANNVNNTAFTLAAAARVLKEANYLRGTNRNATWDEQADGIAISNSDSDITLEFQGMNNSAAVKQADIVLLTYPLGFMGTSENPYEVAEELIDLDYYANRQSPNGPAMTYSIFAINANALSPSGCSVYTYTLNGFLPYLRAPWYQFSEQSVDDPDTNGDTKPAFPFLTGHGGANQIVPFGFLGIRTDQPMLFIDPALPPQIPYVKVRTFHYAGATLSAFINSTHTVLTRLATPKSSTLVDKYANTTLTFNVGKPSTNSNSYVPYAISVNQTITVANRVYWQIKSMSNNLLQCLPATSSAATVAGQFAVAALDGASSTRWQPFTNETASLTVNMTSVPFAPVASIMFDWGSRPPKSATVYLRNSSSGSTDDYGDVSIRITNLVPNLPYNATIAASVDGSKVDPVVGNSTNYTVEAGIWSGRYARLEIEGCFEEDGAGATVGEFAIVTGTA